MFLEYYKDNIENKDGEEPQKDVAEGTERTELSDAERTEIESKASSFVADLEHCMMDSYAEPDKAGKPSAGAKYK